MKDSSLTPAKFSAKLQEKSGGQARLKKALMKAMGRPSGDSRPPSLPVTDAEQAELSEILRGFGWPVPDTSG